MLISQNKKINIMSLIKKDLNLDNILDIANKLNIPSMLSNTNIEELLNDKKLEGMLSKLNNIQEKY